MAENIYEINSLLTYVVSVRHSKPKDEIVNICAVFYNESQIKEAKEKLFDHAGTKPIWRRSDNRQKENISDIIDLIKKCDDEQVKLPSFVTSDHEGFPPAYGFDLIGGIINNLTDQIHELKNEIQNLKDSRVNCVSLMEDNCFIKEELLDIKGLLKQSKQKEMSESLRRDSIIVDHIDKILVDCTSAEADNHNVKRSVPLNEEVSDFLKITGQPSAPPLAELPILTDDVDVVKNLDYEHNDSVLCPLTVPRYSEMLRHGNCSSVGAVSSVLASTGARSKVPITVNPENQSKLGKSHSYVSETHSTSKSKDRYYVDEEGFTHVGVRVPVNRTSQNRMSSNKMKGAGENHERRGRRPNNVFGTKSTTSSKFKGSFRTSDIYVGNVDTNADVNDVIAYVNNEIGINAISCTELESQYKDRSWKSFKLTVSIYDREKLLKSELWPQSVNVRKYYNPRTKSQQ